MICSPRRASNRVLVLVKAFDDVLLVLGAFDHRSRILASQGIKSGRQVGPVRSLSPGPLSVQIGWLLIKNLDRRIAGRPKFANHSAGYPWCDPRTRANPALGLRLLARGPTTAKREKCEQAEESE